MDSLVVAWYFDGGYGIARWQWGLGPTMACLTAHSDQIIIAENHDNLSKKQNARPTTTISHRNSRNSRRRTAISTYKIFQYLTTDQMTVFKILEMFSTNFQTKTGQQWKMIRSDLQTRHQLKILVIYSKTFPEIYIK